MASNKDNNDQQVDRKDRCMSAGERKVKNEGSTTQTAFAGAIAGLVARFSIAPLDVVKIRLQLQSSSTKDALSNANSKNPITYRGTFATFRHIVQTEGIKALWKGNIPAEYLYLVYGAIQFSTIRTVTSALQTIFHDDPLPAPAEKLIAGAVAGFVATTATYPLDLLRTRFAAQGNDRVYTGLISAIKKIKKDEGGKGFYRGLGTSVNQIVPSMGLFFACYEGLKQPVEDMQLPFVSASAISGTLASVFSKTAVFPLDLVRKRLQVQGPTKDQYVAKDIPAHRGAYKTMRHILEKEGVRGLFRGLTVGLFKAAPNAAVTMYVYELVMNSMKEVEELD